MPLARYTIEANVRDSDGGGVMTPTIDVRVANGNRTARRW